MQTKNKITSTRKALYVTMLLGVLLSAFGGENLPSVKALNSPSETPTPLIRSTLAPTDEVQILYGADCSSDAYGYNQDGSFFTEVLNLMGIPVSQFGLDAFAAWQPYENTTACWNPLATTYHVEWFPAGTGCTETIFNSANVRNYSSKYCGELATARTLLYSGSGSYYKPIRDMLSQISFDWQSLHDSIKLWVGSESYATSITNKWQTLWDNRGGTVPSGFGQILSGIGVALYKKDYAGGQPDYVQVVDLNQGASIKLMTGNMASPGTGGGPFGGNNPTFTSTSLATAWNKFNSSTSGAFCITNGAFFSGPQYNPTPLAFALKQNGVMVSDGYSGSSDPSGAVMMLELWGDRADIRPLTKDNLYGSSAPNILGGLSENANKSASSYIGRTFIGIDDTNGDSLYDTVLIFNSSYARQTDASTVLRNFGADKVIMFDGGGSTQLRCGANAYVSSSRDIPQTIGVVAGSNSAPNTPSNFRIDGSTQTNITIAWDDVNNETGYKIYKWDWISSFVYFDSVGANVTSFTDTTLTCGSEAYYEVSAYNTNGESVHAGWVHGYTQACSTTIFADVPLDYWANTFIERLYNAGITGGCSISPMMYCPEVYVTRAQMAVFLLRGEHGSAYTPPVATGTLFGDVPAGYWAGAWIEQLSAEGITGGCGNGNYCPEAVVTRDQMAVFLLRAKHGSSYVPPTATGSMFGDVPLGYWADKWIEQLATEGITGGCGNGYYCPTAPVSRAQMAVFLVRTFNLP